MSEVTVTDLARNLSDYLNRATYRREEFVITRGGKPVATLSPVPSGVRISDLERVFSGLPDLAPGDLAVMESDLVSAREAGNDPTSDPWPSS